MNIPPDPALLDKANELAHRFILCDGHIDFPWRLSEDQFSDAQRIEMAVASEGGDFDYVRAKKGGLSAPFFAIYIASSFQEDLNEAKKHADSLIAMLQTVILSHPEKFAFGLSPDEIETNFKSGLISISMGLENGAPVIGLQDVQYYYDKGIRYITLTHAKDNHICDSSYDTAQTWNGLSVYGKQVIEEMNRAGMIIDVSHISDKAFYQVMERSLAPVLATHSSCRYFTPGWERNMDDDMIQLLAKNDGVIQINFGSDFLDAKVAKKREGHRKELGKILQQENLTPDDPAAKAIIEAYKIEHPGAFADVYKVADHIDHVRKIAGIEFVGIGSDFDGLGDSLPEGLKDVSMYPNLIAELLKRNYSESDIENICYKNVWRVWHKVNEIAGIR